MLVHWTNKCHNWNLSHVLFGFVQVDCENPAKFLVANLHLSEIDVFCCVIVLDGYLNSSQVKHIELLCVNIPHCQVQLHDCWHHSFISTCLNYVYFNYLRKKEKDLDFSYIKTRNLYHLDFPWKFPSFLNLSMCWKGDKCLISWFW